MAHLATQVSKHMTEPIFIQDGGGGGGGAKREGEREREDSKTERERGEQK